ncbi:MAG: hypothetical protein OXH77_11855 [Anaerolineaceae bacterium]|nr:hypothetical protein [Anaerolineaceae bacterium]
MANKVRFEVLVRGEGFALVNVRIKEISNLLVAVEEIVSSIVERDHPKLETSKQGALGLTSVRAGSLHAGFASHFEEVVQAWHEVSRSIERQDYTDLPAKATDKLGSIEKFNRKHNTDTEFWLDNGSRKHLATVTTDAGLPQSHFIFGTTTFYGRLLRIGGKKRPTAYIELAEDETLKCYVKTTDLASKMAKRLYDVIGVRGTAKWNIADNVPEHFTVEQLMEYRQTSLLKAMQSLREVAGEHYKEIEDVNAFVAELRGRGEQDE